MLQTALLETSEARMAADTKDNLLRLHRVLWACAAALVALDGADAGRAGDNCSHTHAVGCLRSRECCKPYSRKEEVMVVLCQEDARASCCMRDEGRPSGVAL